MTEFGKLKNGIQLAIQNFELINEGHHKFTFVVEFARMNPIKPAACICKVMKAQTKLYMVFFGLTIILLIMKMVF